MRPLYLLVGILFCMNLGVMAQTEDCVGAIPVCGNGTLNLNSNGVGADDFASANNFLPECQFQESQSLWLRIEIKQGGTLGFDLVPDNNTGANRDDYDFAVYGPNRPCNNLGRSIRCSSTNPQAANVQAETGMNGTETDINEGPGADGNGFIRWMNVTAGETYYIMIDNFSQNNGFELNWTGTALLEDEITKAEGGVDLGPDISVCPENDNIELVASVVGGGEYLWSTGEDTETIIPQVSGEFWVQVTNASGCISRDTVQVDFLPAPTIDSATATPDEFCEPGDITFSATGSETLDGRYSWFFPDGSLAGTGRTITLPNLDASSSGDFRVRSVNDQGCTTTVRVPVNIEALPAVGFSGRTEVCENEDLVLVAEEVNRIDWKDPSGNIISTMRQLTIPNIQASDAGTYRFIAFTTFGCIDSIDFVINVQPELVVSGSTNSPLCTNETLELIASSNTAASYTWLNPSGQSIGTGSNLTISDLATTDSGNYTLRAENSIGCIDEEVFNIRINQSYIFEDSITLCPGDFFTIPQTGEVITTTSFNTVNLLTQENCDSIYTYDVVFLSCGDEDCTGLPTAFAPNDNNRNEQFRPILSPGCVATSYQLDIFDRWGNVVFSSESYANGWRGEYESGDPAQGGLYLWQVRYEFEENGTTSSKELNGSVNLIR